MTTFPEHFLWGAATAGHQIEGNNVNSDWWAREQQMPGMELSGDACDSYHRYAEDIQLLFNVGLTVANTPTPPRWKPTSEFRTAGDDRLRIR